MSLLVPILANIGVWSPILANIGVWLPILANTFPWVVIFTNTIIGQYWPMGTHIVGSTITSMGHH